MVAERCTRYTHGFQVNAESEINQRNDNRQEQSLPLSPTNHKVARNRITAQQPAGGGPDPPAGSRSSAPGAGSGAGRSRCSAKAASRRPTARRRSSLCSSADAGSKRPTRCAKVSAERPGRGALPCTWPATRVARGAWPSCSSPFAPLRGSLHYPLAPRLVSKRLKF